jgi:hypothetical protein
MKTPARGSSASARPSDQFCGDAEEGEFALTGLAKVQLQQAFVVSLVFQRVDFYQWE